MRENNVLITDKAYSYDETSWLLSVTENLKNASIDFTYDKNGNTISKQDNTQATPVSTVFTYNTRDQLVQTQRGPPGNETTILG